MRVALVVGTLACAIAVGCLLPELGPLAGGDDASVDASVDVATFDAGPDSNADAAKDAAPDGKPIALYRINAGGLAVGSFVSDIFFDGGSVNSGGSTIDLSLAGDAAAPESAYTVYRFTDPTPFTYALPTDPNRPVLVRLHFADVFQTDAGARIFDVQINGTTVLKNFDIIATAKGPNKAILRDFPATADANGNVVVTFVAGSAGNAIINAIELYTR